MSDLDLLSRWLVVVTWSMFALGALLWSVLFGLHSVGRWKGIKGGFPSQQFWKTFPRRRSRLVVPGLAIVAVLCGLSAIGKVQSLRIAERDNEIPLVQLGRELDLALRELAAVAGTLYEDSHRQAIKDGKLQEWAAEIIGKLTQDPESLGAIAFFTLQTDDPAVQNDLIYCLQEASGTSFNIQLGVEPSRAAHKSNLTRLSEEFDIDDYVLSIATQ
jgi:hypothetical protein